MKPSLLLTLSFLLLSTGIQRTNTLVLQDEEQAASKKPRILIQPERAVFYIPETTGDAQRSMVCSSQGDSPGLFSELKWSAPGVFANSDELAKRHEINEYNESNTVQLNFKNPKPSDNGVYYCSGVYQNTNPMNASMRVVIYQPLKVLNCPNRQFVVANRVNQKISCKITAEGPTMYLTKDGKPIKSSENKYRWDYDGEDGGIIINNPATIADAGEYGIKVNVFSTGEYQSIKINVEVHTEPVIKPYDGTGPEFYGTEGESATLKCEVSGNPKPLVYWLDAQKRNLSSVGGYHENQVEGTLLIERLTRQYDNGRFECVAVNSVDRTSRPVTMVVYSRPQITAFENKTVEEGGEVTLECRATGEPKPNFSIRREGLNQTPYMIGNGAGDVDIKVEEAGRLVYIHRTKIIANRSMAAVHFCNATNQAGTAERVGFLHVEFKPDLSNTPTEQYIALGKQVVFTCQVKAYPTPTITWWQDDLEIKDPVSSFKSSPDGQVHTATMSPPNFQQYMNSRYFCHAINKRGFDKRQIIPKFKSPPGPINAVLIDRYPTSVKLRLTVQHDGGDRIRYFKYSLKGQTLDHNNPLARYQVHEQKENVLDATSATSEYTIRNLKPYYSYKISIYAQNDMGIGDMADISVETRRPMQPFPPVILRPSSSSSRQSSIPSEYQNGYHLKWSPPESDNGDPITEYNIRVSRLNKSLNSLNGYVLEKSIQQMSERPLNAKLGPLEVDQSYKIDIVAVNSHGQSDSDYIFINTPAGKPSMPEYDALVLGWFMDSSTPTLIAIMTSAVFLLIVIDLIFCFSCQIGLSHFIRTKCCPSKTASVMSEK